MSLYEALCVLMGSDQFLWVFNGPYVSMSFLMGFYGFLYSKSICVLKDSNWSLWVFVGSYASLCIQIGPYGSL